RRADERYQQEQVEYEEKIEKRNKRKHPGKAPKPPEPGAGDKDQVNLTDDESRIMPTAGGAFEQAYNAQASVDIGSGLIVTRHVTQAPNDKKEVEPTLRQLRILAPVLGKAEGLLADTGYFSEANVCAVDKEELTPYIAIKRDEHNPPPLQRFQPDPPVPDDDASVLEWMRWRLQTQEGRAIYSRRKCTIEPTFGIQKEAMGYRRFLVRGLEVVSKEWDLVCLTFNLRRMFNLKQVDDKKWLALVLYWLVVSHCLMRLRWRSV
uniref:transposase n=2 Tax=Parendozoicomonas sp. Alg238-R29 TaxID=2993446 RepID=UPI00248D5E1B